MTFLVLFLEVFLSNSIVLKLVLSILESMNGHGSIFLSEAEKMPVTLKRWVYVLPTLMHSRGSDWRSSM